MVCMHLKASGKRILFSLIVTKMSRMKVSHHYKTQAQAEAQCFFRQTISSDRFKLRHTDEYKINAKITSKVKLLHQNVPWATNKLDEVSVVCDELSPYPLIITEHRFKHNNISPCKIKTTSWQILFCRLSFHGGGVGIVLKIVLLFNRFELKAPTKTDFEAIGVKLTSKNHDKIVLIYIYRSSSGN